MSVRHNQEIDCPHCGNKFEMLIWDSINADLDPEAREALLDGRIHVSNCPTCQKTIKAANSILYHDMRREFFVLYCPFQSIKDPSFFGSFSSDGHLDLNTGLAEEDAPKYAKNVHYVFSMNELGRYIRFREALGQKKPIGVLEGGSNDEKEKGAKTSGISCRWQDRQPAG